MARRIAFVTFGCRLNTAEALDMEARGAADGWNVVPVDGPTPPDRIVVRGCSVTARAQRDSEHAVKSLAKRFPNAEVVATGCLPQTTAHELPTAKPETENQPQRTARAYLKVQDGCSCKCAFCIVPSFRGAPRSVPFHEARERALAFLAAGHREIVVTGCNLSLYRSEGRGLPELLSALASLDFPERHRIRLGSIEPGVCDSELVDAMAAHSAVCRFLHISLQSASDAILKSMRRPYNAAQAAELCNAAALKLGPRLALGADVIAGFPGETESDFAATRDFLSASYGDGVHFTNIHAFPYSERPGTEAATMPGSLPHQLRRKRAHVLHDIGMKNREAFAKSLAGCEVEVCVEKIFADGTAEGWTEEYLRAHAPHGPRRSLVRSRYLLDFFRQSFVEKSP